MKQSIFYIALLLAVVNSTTAKSQDIVPAEVKLALQQLQAKYSQPKLLGMHVAYRYTNEHDAKNVLDTLSGNAVLQGDNYYYEIGNTKTVKAGEYSIMLFSEDKLMYLMKNARQNNSPVSVVTGLDSLVAQVKGVKISLANTATTKTISVVFPGGYAYKNMTLSIDKQTGYMTSCSYIVKTEQLTDTGALDDAARKKFEPYAKVTAIYNYYQPKAEQVQLFDSTHFFNRTAAGELMPASGYNDYTIYKATPNL